ncbi:MAG: hypothetical protein EOO68_29835 [Moraxellaceae bacterium]|nr:MAG: hypothetical protein EOO68_29835 [Moraxellaceae bacterium]
MNRCVRVAHVLGCFLLAQIAEAGTAVPMVFTHRVPDAYNSGTASYEASVLKLALDKTIDEYGPYEFRVAPAMNITRSIQGMKSDSFPNLIVTLGYKDSYSADGDIAYIRFPIDLGILGYRTCFAPKSMLGKISKINTLDELRKLSIGQGRGWVDSAILKANGFNVVEAEPYSILFKMTAAHRFDLFCRGANEVKEEYDHWQDLDGFGYDRHLLIYYPMPIFFYTNTANTQAIARVTKGLHKAYADGSLMALWFERHKDSVNFANLGKRKVFRLENPMAKSVDFDYTRYFYNLNVNKYAQP